MSWTCIVGVINNEGPLWTYVTKDCVTLEHGIAIAQAGLPSGTCNTPESPSCWENPAVEAPMSSTTPYQSIKIVDDGLSEEQLEIARIVELNVRKIMIYLSEE